MISNVLRRRRRAAAAAALARHRLADGRNASGGTRLRTGAAAAGLRFRLRGSSDHPQEVRVGTVQLRFMSPMGHRRFPRVLVAAAALAVLAAACGNSPERASFSGGVDAFGDSPTADAEPPTTDTTLSAGSIVLSPDGLGVLRFGKQAAQALKGLTQALGRAEDWRTVPSPADCGATRIFTWKNFDVLVNEAAATSATTRGLVGWNLRDGGPAALDLKTEQGIGIGSTLAALEAAYGDLVTVAHTATAPTVTITTANGVITGDLDGAGDSSRVRSLRAGATCGT